MSVPNVLLLTGTPPSYGVVGGIFLSDLCKYYPKGHICCFAVCDDSRNPLPQDLSWMPIIYSLPPRTYGFLKLGRGFAHLSNNLVWQYTKNQMSKLIEQAVQFGKQYRVDLVWAILDFPAPMYMAKRVADKLNAKLITLVWDPPEYVLSDVVDHDKFFYHSFLNEFEKTLKASVRCGVMSNEMKNLYEKKFGVDSIIIRHGIHPDKWRSPTIDITNKKQFVIGYAGTLYAKREWESLLSALSKLNWSIDGRDIIIRLIGSGFELRSKNKTNIEYLGYHSVEETIYLMSEVDVAYLPYWFDESHRLAALLSFPTKLTTYLASGKPVMFHGPENSSLAHFFQRFSVGLCCHSLEESSIIKCLQRFVTDKDFYATAIEAGQRALHEEFDLRVFLKRFAKLIGINESELLLLNSV